MTKQHYTIKNYTDAERVLNSAKSRANGKPIDNNTRLVPTTLNGVDGIGVLLHATIVVNYTPDGRIVINTGGWWSRTTRDRIESYSPARLFTDTVYNLDGTKCEAYKGYKTWVIASHNIGTTPTAIKKCRTCKGDGIINYTGYVGQCEGCDDPAYANRNHSIYAPATRKCDRCDETGLTDYGSHAIYPVYVDGVTLDQTGKVTGRTAGTPRYYTPNDGTYYSGNSLTIRAPYIEQTEAQQLERLTDPRNASAPFQGHEMLFNTGNPEQDAEIESELKAWNELLTGGKACHTE